MEVVVGLALLVLAVVFLLSTCLLVFLCRRRRALLARREEAFGQLRFARLRGEHVDSLLQLSPLLDNSLEHIDWVEEATGAYENMVALLRLTAALVKQLSQVDLSKCPPRVYALICDAMTRVGPSFDELASSSPATPLDLRVVEARAVTLWTVCWSLVAPFTLLPLPQRDELDRVLAEMQAHCASLREAASLLEPAPDEEEGPAETTITYEQLPPVANGSPPHPVDPVST